MNTAVLILIASLLAPAAPGAASPAPAPILAEGRPASLPADSIGGLLSEPAPGSGDRESSAGGMLFRMLGWVAALAVAAVAGIGIWKRLVLPQRIGTEPGGVRVVGRAALTPKHAIYTVRVANQRLLVVGVSGDRMTTLTEFNDPAQVLAMDPSFQKALTAADGRPGDGEAAAMAPPLDGELSTYRAEVKRLADVVRGWRGRLGRALGTEARVRTGD